MALPDGPVATGVTFVVVVPLVVVVSGGGGLRRVFPDDVEQPARANAEQQEYATNDAENERKPAFWLRRLPLHRGAELTRAVGLNWLQRRWWRIATLPTIGI